MYSFSLNEKPIVTLQLFLFPGDYAIKCVQIATWETWHARETCGKDLSTFDLTQIPPEETCKYVQSKLAQPSTKKERARSAKTEHVL